MKLARIICLALSLLLLLCAVPFAAAADEGEVIYENDFSDPATLADFNQYRVNFEIRDGALYVAGPAEGIDIASFGWLIYNKDVAVKDYQVDVDVYNFRTAAGIVARADMDLVGGESNNHFAGYIGFISNNGKSGAMGGSKPEDVSGYLGNFTDMYGQSSVLATGLEPGCNAHLCFSLKDDVLRLVISDPSDKAVLYDVTCYDTNWTEGSFGLRVKLTNGSESNIDNVYFDNFKVTALTSGGAAAETEAPETETPETAGQDETAPAETEAIGETRPAETKAAETKAAETKANDTKAAAGTEATGTKPAGQSGSDKGIPAYVWAIVGVVAAAAIACGAILAKKKKN
ncbi:MAG: hypothetical protein IJR89_07645 [Clostridia bacterium]|nr:hypothetical protein [Clostridia bacterium]